MQLSLFFISQCSVLLLDAVMYSTQVSLLSSVPRLFFLKFYVMAAWGRAKQGQNGKIAQSEHVFINFSTPAAMHFGGGKDAKKKKNQAVRTQFLQLGISK